MQLLPTTRGVIKYWLFSLITFGIYPFYLIYATARELNLTCFEDGKRTTGLFGFILLSFLTCGIYAIAWFCLTSSRMGAFFVRRGWQPRITGTSYFCWMFFGSLLFGIGPLVAMYKYLHSLNDINSTYNIAITQIVQENKNKPQPSTPSMDVGGEMHQHSFEEDTGDVFDDFLEDSSKKQM